jgi:integrase/recombinase XerD
MPTPSSSPGRGSRSTSSRRQLGHIDLGTTSTYLQGIDPSEVIDAVRSRRQPTISATAGLRL